MEGGNCDGDRGFLHLSRVSANDDGAAEARIEAAVLAEALARLSRDHADLSICTDAEGECPLVVRRP